MEAPIAKWERERFEREALAEIDGVETAEPARTIVAPADTERPELVAVAGRITAGLAVQLLVEPKRDGRAWLTLGLNGKTETIEVPAGQALDAYLHPYCYGASLPL